MMTNLRLPYYCHGQWQKSAHQKRPSFVSLGDQESQDGESKHSSRQSERAEHGSPQRSLDHCRASQAHHTGMRPKIPPSPIFTEITVWEGKAPYSWLWSNPIESIRNLKKHKACADVFAAFLGPLRNVILLMLDLERQAVHGPKGCYIKDANVFMSKILTLV